MSDKIQWHGLLTSVQPRIRLMRSFDERSHTYLGYALRVYGTVGSENREFLVGVGKGTHGKHRFQVGCDVSGECLPVADPRLENVEYYKVSKLEVHDPSTKGIPEPPPWLGVPPELPVYRQRGHRRLDARTYAGRCSSCVWGCRMAVEMIVDQWKPQVRRYRYETFCYGPKSCAIYKAGPTRKVPGRKGMSHTEEDWVDEDATSHRGPDE